MNDEIDRGSLSELEALVAELKRKVAELRAGELDAAALESRLREINDLANRAASTLDAAAR